MEHFPCLRILILSNTKVLVNFCSPWCAATYYLVEYISVSTDGPTPELHGTLVGANELVSVCGPEVVGTVQMPELSVTLVNPLMFHGIYIRFPILLSLCMYAAREFFPDTTTQAWDPEVHVTSFLLFFEVNCVF